jgi:hypothetical protein
MIIIVITVVRSKVILIILILKLRTNTKYSNDNGIIIIIKPTMFVQRGIIGNNDCCPQFVRVV